LVAPLGLAARQCEQSHCLQRWQLPPGRGSIDRNRWSGWRDEIRLRL